jgi:hypothetical protein
MSSENKPNQYEIGDEMEKVIENVKRDDLFIIPIGELRQVIYDSQNLSDEELTKKYINNIRKRKQE